jgi:hypothetical protein
MSTNQLRGGVDAASGYPYVEQHYVRSGLLGDLNGIGCGGAFSYHLDFPGAVQQFNPAVERLHVCKAERALFAYSISEATLQLAERMLSPPRLKER